VELHSVGYNAAELSVCFMMLPCLAYTSTLKIDNGGMFIRNASSLPTDWTMVACSSETPGDLQTLHNAIYQKKEVFLNRSANFMSYAA
jgi:hypothetical protein